MKPAAHFATMREIARLRELAATGMSATRAEHELGRARGFALLWAPRYGIEFIPYGRRQTPRTPRRRPPHPALADLAMARLAATLARLRAPL